MLKKIVVVLCCSIMFSSISAKSSSAKSRKPQKGVHKIVHTPRYLLIDYNSDMVIDQYGKDERIAPSSMTKLVTLYILFSQIKSGVLSLQDTMVVSRKATHTGGSRSWLLEGSNVTVDDLIRCIIVQSGNDAAVVVAENISGSVEKFSQLMNETAASLGMNNSHFENPSGLPDDNHYSTVSDIAIISKRLIQDFPEFYHYFAQKEFEVNGIRQPNRNRLLWSDIGVDGLKTGHTDKGGYGLAASALKDGVRLISVVNGYATQQAREVKTKELLSRGFRSVVTYTISQNQKPLYHADVWLGNKETVPLVTEYDIKLSLLKNDVKSLKIYAACTSPIKAPIKKGDYVGDLIIECGTNRQTHKLFAGESVAELGIFDRAISALRFMLFGRSSKK